MTWFLWIAIVLLAVVLVWSLVRYRALRRRLEEYSARVRRAADGSAPASGLPADVAGLEQISNAVVALSAAFDFQLSTLESERARLAAVLDQMTDAVLIADPEGRVQYANPAAERLSGGQAIGRSISEVLRHHRLIQAWQRSQESGEVTGEWHLEAHLFAGDWMFEAQFRRVECDSRRATASVFDFTSDRALSKVRNAVCTERTRVSSVRLYSASAWSLANLDF